MKIDLNEQIESAKKEIKKMKKHCPNIFTQYCNMMHAKREYEQAKLRYQQAKKIWKEL